MMKAVILAGGKGTRLGNDSLPKPMIKIGSLPILEHQINLLKKYGVTDITLITGYLSEVIEDYFQDGKTRGVNISYYKEKTPLGTTGGLKAIEADLKEDFFLLYGDVMVNMDLNRLARFHKENKSDATLVLHPNDHPYDSDLVEIDESSRITKFHSKPHEENSLKRNLVNAALYILSPKILESLEKGEKADWGRDIFPKICGQIRCFGYNTAEYLKDVGTPERLEEVNEDYRSEKIKRFNREYKRKSIFLDRDGVLNKEIDLLYQAEDLELLPKIPEAIQFINRSEYLAIVVTNQPVVARNLCTIEELQTIHNKLETVLGKERAKLDAIYFCPHHPDKGYPEENPLFKIDCECRKPKAGLIKRAQMAFNIDLENSFIIGDSVRDIECGKRANLTTIGVKTGYGCQDGDSKPDFLFENLHDAIHFILQTDSKKGSSEK